MDIIYNYSMVNEFNTIIECTNEYGEILSNNSIYQNILQNNTGTNLVSFNVKILENITTGLPLDLNLKIMIRINL